MVISFLLASSALIVVLAGNARLSAMLAARTIASAVDDLLDLAPRVQHRSARHHDKIY